MREGRRKRYLGVTDQMRDDERMKYKLSQDWCWESLTFPPSSVWRGIGEC
jgi:hypothetical protein